MYYGPSHLNINNLFVETKDRGNKKSIRLIKGKREEEFTSHKEAMAFLGLSPSSSVLATAIKRGKKVHGWSIEVIEDF